MKFSVLGGSGFIGGHMAAHLRAQGHEVDVPPRDTELLQGRSLGHVIYAIGLTGNFRQRPYDAIEAHVNVACRVLQNTSFDSFLYLSSTRVYGGLPPDAAGSEEMPLAIQPSADSLYDLSKLLGEAVCMGVSAPAVRVARLSNVYGPGQSPHTFLGAVLKEISETGKVTIHDDPDSSKDYVALPDVLQMLENIALRGRHRIYNVASGAPVRSGDLARWLKEAGCAVTFSGKGKPRAFPRIDISRITQEFGFQPRALKQELAIVLKKEKAT